MVFAYASAILLVQYNQTELNEKNFGLCLTDLIMICSYSIFSFFVYLPYNSIFLNIIVMLINLYMLIYNSYSIYLYNNHLKINDDYYNASIAVIVFSSSVMLFEILRNCNYELFCHLRHWLDMYADEDGSTISSQFYSIKQLIVDNYCFENFYEGCYACYACFINCCSEKCNKSEKHRPAEPTADIPVATIVNDQSQNESSRIPFANKLNPV